MGNSKSRDKNKQKNKTISTIPVVKIRQNILDLDSKLEHHLDKNEQELVLTYHLPGDPEPSNSDIISVFKDSDSATAIWSECADGTRHGNLRVNISEFGVDDGEFFVAKYFINDDGEQCRCATKVFKLPISNRKPDVSKAQKNKQDSKDVPLNSFEQVSEPVVTNVKKDDDSMQSRQIVHSELSSDSALALPVSQISENYSIKVDWDMDQEYLFIKISCSPTTKLFGSQCLKLVRINEKHPWLTVPCPDSKEGEEKTVFLDLRKASKEDLEKSFVIQMCESHDADAKILVESPKFPFPTSRGSLEKFPQFSAFWDEQNQSLKLEWDQQLTTSSMKFFIYESGIDVKSAKLYEHDIPMNCNYVITPPSKELREGNFYYARLVKSLSPGNANRTLACSTNFKITKLNSLAELQVCEITTLEPEIEVDTDDVELLSVQVKWKFEKDVPDISLRDTISLVQASSVFNPEEWQYCHGFASGKLEGSVLIFISGFVDNSTPYCFHYVRRSGISTSLGKSKPIVFSTLPKLDQDQESKAKQKSRTSNATSAIQHSLKTISSKFNPLLTIVPEASEYQKLFDENQKKKKKAQVLESQNSSTNQTNYLRHDKEDIKLISSTELGTLVNKDFELFGGFIYAGAGISMGAPSLSPSWWVLMNALLKEVFSAAPPEFSEFIGRLTTGDTTRQPEEIMESFYFVLQDRLLTVFELLEAGQPNANHIAIAKLAKSGKIRGVLTTNFDLFIERALKAEGVEFQVIVTNDEFTTFYEQGCKGPFSVLKIHGTVDRPSTIVAVANHYKNGKGFSGAKELVLSNYLRNHPTLFLGYSGWDFQHANYQTFWSNQGDVGGKNIYWLNLIGATGGPNLNTILGSHIGKRLVVGEGTLPDWICSMLLNENEAGQVMTFHKSINENAVSKRLLDERHRFLETWVKKIPVPQLMTLLQIEGTALNKLTQERLKRRKEMRIEQQETTNITELTNLYTQLSMEYAAKKISLDQFLEQQQVITLRQTFQSVPLSKSKKDSLIQMFQSDCKVNPLFVVKNQGSDVEQTVNRSLFPNIVSSIAENKADASVESIYEEAVTFIAEKLSTKPDDRLATIKRTLYMYNSSYLRCDDEGRSKCEKLLEDFATTAFNKNIPETAIISEAQSAIGKKINELAFGLVDFAPMIDCQFKTLLESYDENNLDSFFQNALCVALGIQRTAPTNSLPEISQRKEYQQLILTPMYSNESRDIPHGNFEKFREIFHDSYSPERKKVMNILEGKLNNAKSAEVLATFLVAEMEMYFSVFRYSGPKYQEEQDLESRGFYPRESLPEFASTFMLESLQRCESQVQDQRVLQMIFGQLNAVAESLGNLESLKTSTENSLNLTGEKVLEVTPVGIPESYAFALQMHGKLAEALNFYKRALEGIKTSVTRQKADAIILQACLIQGTFDKTNALKMAFSYSPHFSFSQQFSTVGHGRALLIQQCAQWAKDLGFNSLDEAEEQLATKE